MSLSRISTSLAPCIQYVTALRTSPFGTRRFQFPAAGRSMSTAGNKSEPKAQVQAKALETTSPNVETLLLGMSPPKGYTLITASGPGADWLTRRCRELAGETNQKLYAPCLEPDNGQMQPSTWQESGLYVPKDIYHTAESEYIQKQADLRKLWFKRLDKRFPKIPPGDRDNILRLFNDLLAGRVKNNKSMHDVIRRYVKDRYTNFEATRTQFENTSKGEARQKSALEQGIRRQCRKADKIMAKWRGKEVKV